MFVAHLDHPKESANDNASGSAAILDIASALNDLIDSGRLTDRDGRSASCGFPSGTARRRTSTRTRKWQGLCSVAAGWRA